VNQKTDDQKGTGKQRSEPAPVSSVIPFSAAQHPCLLIPSSHIAETVGSCGLAHPFHSDTSVVHGQRQGKTDSGMNLYAFHACSFALMISSSLI
jgi:hypothetical protein